MLTEEKLTWINLHIRRGDKQRISALLPGIDYSVIVAVLNQKLWGANGQLIIDATIQFLQDRIEREKQEKKRYAALLKAV